MFRPMTQRRSLFLPALAVLVLASLGVQADPASYGPVAGAFPAAAAGGAEGFVKSKHKALNRHLKNGDDAKIDAVFDEMLDYDSLAKESLGRYWGERSEAERVEFSELLKQLVRRAYRKNLKKTTGYEVSYNGEESADGDVIVKTVAKSKTDSHKDPVSIDYLVHSKSGGLLVKDINTEGSSLVRNYRSQFRRIIKKKGWDELIRRMKKKAAKG